MTTDYNIMGFLGPLFETSLHCRISSNFTFGIYIYIQTCMCLSNVSKTRTGSVQGNTFSKPMNFRVNTVSLSTVNKIVNQSIETGWGAHVSSFCFITSPPVWTDEIAFPSSFHTWRNYGISFHREVSQQLIWLDISEPSSEPILIILTIATVWFVVVLYHLLGCFRMVLRQASM